MGQINSSQQQRLFQEREVGRKQAVYPFKFIRRFFCWHCQPICQYGPQKNQTVWHVNRHFRIFLPIKVFFNGFHSTNTLHPWPQNPIHISHSLDELLALWTKMKFFQRKGFHATFIHSAGHSFAATKEPVDRYRNSPIQYHRSSLAHSPVLPFQHNSTMFDLLLLKEPYMLYSVCVVGGGGLLIKLLRRSVVPSFTKIICWDSLWKVCGRGYNSSIEAKPQHSGAVVAAVRSIVEKRQRILK